MANEPNELTEQERKAKQEIERVKARRLRQAKLSLLCDEIMKFMQIRPGFYGGDTKEAIAYLRAKLRLDYSNSLIREALSYLIKKGKIKRAKISQKLDTPDTAYLDKGVIFYLDGCSDEKFPPEFRDFREKMKKPVVLEIA